MLQPRKPLDLSGANEILNEERPPLDLSGAESILKKKENLSSTEAKPKSVLDEKKLGSSVGKKNNPFGEVKDYRITSNKVTTPRTVETASEKEIRLRRELSKVKVTPENADQISQKTDELSKIISEKRTAENQAKSNRVKQLETAFYSEVNVPEDEQEAEKRLQDRVSGKGFMNTIATYSKKALNTVIDLAVSANPTNAALLNAKVNEDPFADEKKIVRAEAKKNKEKISDAELEERAKQRYKEKERENIFIDKANSFLDNLDDEDKKLLEQDRYEKAVHLQEDNLKRGKVVAAMEIVGNQKIEQYKEIEARLKSYQEKKQEFPQELYEQYLGLSKEIKAISKNIEKNSNYIQKNTKDLGTAKQEFDLFKRENGDWMNFGGNFAASTGDIAVGLLGFVNYASSFGSPLDRVRAMQGQEVAAEFTSDLEQYRETLRKPVEGIESAEGLFNYASDLVANQIPNLIMTSTGTAGLVGVAAVSAGQKNTEMLEEVSQGKASYSPLQMAVAPLLQGTAEVISEIPTLSILKKGGRVLKSIGTSETNLITKTAKQKAVEWSKDYGIDMSKEMAGEQFTNFTQNFNDKYVLGKKNVNLLDNTGRVFKDTFTLTSILKVAPHTFGAITKPFQSKNDLGVLDENSRKILQYSKQLQSGELSEVEKSVVQKEIDKVTAQSSKIVANTIGSIADMPGVLYDEVIKLNTKAGEIKAQAKEINDGSLPNKKELLSSLAEEYKTLQEKRTSIIDRNTSVIEVLPLQEQETLKRQAMEDLVTELNPDGKKDITITNDQVVARATEIYNESQQNENTTTQTSAPASNEAATPSVNELNNNSGLNTNENNTSVVPNEAIPNSSEIKQPVGEQPTPDTKEQATEAEPAPSVSQQPTPIRQLGTGANVYFETDFYRVNDTKNGKVLLNVNDNTENQMPVANLEFDTAQEAVVVADQIAKAFPNGVPPALDVAKYVNQLKAKNATTPSQNPPVNGNVSPGAGVVEQDGTQESNSAENVPETAEPTASENDVEVVAVGEKTGIKAANIRDLYKVNQTVFGQNKVKSLAGAVIMDRMIGAMAKKANVTKAEIYAKLDFKKGDQKTFEQLSKNGKALFQIVGTNAKLAKNVKDNLQVARNMESAGKNAQEIRLTTGWEKGADGKWGYEIDDSKVTISEKIKPGGTLADLINHPELFAMYPELANVKIIVNNRMDFSAVAIAESNKILINETANTDPKELKATILHEVQHLIQSKEGWSLGATPDAIRQKLNEAANENSKLKGSVKRIIGKIFSKKTGLLIDPSKAKQLLNKADFDLYQSLVGETQSRNVETRMDMTAEQRRNTTLESTEDVRREEQIVLFQGAKGAVEISQDGKAIIYALTDPNISTPMHELAHVYEQYLTDAEKKTVLEWSKQKEWTRETSENFAKGFEKYLADGIAPTAELKKIFEKFKEWLTDIYSGIKDSEIDLKLSPKMQAVYAEMLGEKFVNLEAKPKTDIEFALDQIDKGVLQWNGNIDSPRVDLGITWADIRKGEADLKKGKVNSVPAKRLIEALKEAKEAGGYKYKQVTGGDKMRAATFVSLEDMERSSNENNLTDAEQREIDADEVTLAKEYEDYFNGLDEQSQIDIYENYENQRGNEGVGGELAPEGESKNDVPSQEKPKSKPRKTAKERIKVSDAKIDDIANAIKGMDSIFGIKIKVDNIDGLNKNGVDIIDVIAGIVKQAVAAGINIDEAINKTIEHLKKTIDFEVDIDEVKKKINSEVPKSKPDNSVADQKEQAFSTRAFNSENLNTDAKKKLEALGLNYTTESQALAQRDAEKIIAEIGIEDAYVLAINGQVRGGARMWIMAQAFENMNAKVTEATQAGDLETVEVLTTELAKVIKTFADERTLIGQETSMLNRIYQKFEMKYDVGFARESWNQKFGNDIPVEVEARLTKLEKEIKDLEAKNKELEEKIGALAEQDAMENLKHATKNRGKKQPSPSSLKKAATALRQAKFTKTISDLASLQSDPLGVVKGIFDGAIETIATALDAGSTIEQALKKGITEIKNSNWYKNLSSESKGKADKIIIKDLTEYIKNETTRPEDNAAEPEQGALKIPSDLLYDLVANGIDNITDLTNAVHEIMAEEYAGLSHREVRDAITGYGKQIGETQDDIRKEISRLKTDGKQMSALDDLAEGNRPKRSGRKAKEYTAEQRNKIKKIKELLKSLPIDDNVDLEKFYKNALENYKTRVQNRIKDLSEALSKNQRIVNEKRNTVLDDDAKSLVEQRDALQKEYDETFGKPYKSDETLINEIIKRKEKSLRDLELELESVKNDGKQLPKKEKRTVTDPRIDEINGKIDRVREDLNDALEQVGIAEAKRLERAKNYAKKRLGKLNKDLAEGNFQKRKPKTFKYDRELIDLKGQLILAKTKWDMEFEKQEFKDLGYSEKLLEYAYRVFGTVKGLKATIDLSAMLRQGIILGSRHPKAFIKSAKLMHQFAFSEKKYNDWRTELESSDDYIYIVEDKVALTDMSGDVLRGEDNFVGNLLTAEVKVAGANVNVPGALMKGSERAYGGMLNVLRVTVYRDIVKQYEVLGITRQEHPKKYQNIGRFVNNATGRGALTSDKNLAKVLNMLLFSPRMITAMGGLVKDMVRTESTPLLRKQAATSLLTFTAYQYAMKSLIFGALTSMGMMGWLGDDEEEVTMDMNPVSTDFNKVKRGNTRYDVSSGYGIALRTIARVMLEEKSSGIDSENKKYTDTFGKTPWSEIPDFFLNKLNPLASQIYKYKAGAHPNDLGKKKEEATLMDYTEALLVPIGIADLIENMGTEGKPKALTAFDFMLNTYGVGVQTYGDKENSKNSLEGSQAKKEKLYNLSPQEKIKTTVINRLKRKISAIKVIEEQLEARSKNKDYFINKFEKISAAQLQEINVEEQKLRIKKLKEAIEIQKDKFKITDDEL